MAAILNTYVNGIGVCIQGLTNIVVVNIVIIGMFHLLRVEVENCTDQTLGILRTLLKSFSNGIVIHRAFKETKQSKDGQITLIVILDLQKFYTIGNPDSRAVFL